MNREERLAAILEMLRPAEAVQSKELMDRFGVSDMTIRRDLSELASQGKVIRTHGGAILVGPEEESRQKGEMAKAVPLTQENPREGNKSLEPAYMARVSAHHERKEQIARTCLELLKHKKYVYLDSGSTTYSIAQLATPKLGCIFLTNGINIATALLSSEYPLVISIGGEIHLNTWATRGPFAESQIRQFHADVAFIGCNAISPEGDVMIGNMTESGLKRAIMEISNEVYLVADSSKFETFSLTSYASVRDFDGIVTDEGLSLENREKITSVGGKLLIAGEEC